MADAAGLVDPTLLPPPLARDLSCRALEALGARLGGIDLMPLVVVDYDTVPASALPSLAEQLRMLGDAGWVFAADEAQQRALLKGAVSLHRRRGTVWAIKYALSLLNVNATVSEWFEQSPPGAPYTFALSVDPLDQPEGMPLLDLARWGDVARVVNYWKNARSLFSVAAQSENIGLGLLIAMTAAGREAGEIEADFVPIGIKFPLLFAMAAAGREDSTVTATFEAS